MAAPGLQPMVLARRGGRGESPSGPRGRPWRCRSSAAAVMLEADSASSTALPRPDGVCEKSSWRATENTGSSMRFQAADRRNGGQDAARSEALNRRRVAGRAPLSLARNASFESSAGGSLTTAHRRHAAPPSYREGALLRGGVARRNGRPIQHGPPGLHIVGAAVLILEIIGMLPHVVAEQRCSAVHPGRVLV